MENNNSLNQTATDENSVSSCYPVEVNKKRRGHTFFAGLKGIPLLYDTEQVPPEDKIIHAHFFVGGADWYVAELDPASMEAFGWARIVPGGGEWGYTDLTELERTRVKPGFVVERDIHWTPRPFKECVSDPRY